MLLDKLVAGVPKLMQEEPSPLHLDSYTQGEELSVDYKIAERLLPGFEKWRMEAERALRHNWWS